MSAGGIVGAPPGAAAPMAPGASRNLIARKAGFVPGGLMQDPQETAWLQALAQIGRQPPPAPQARGLAGVRRLR